MLLEYLENCLKEVSIDFVIFGFDGNELKVLLVEWRNTSHWSLPGGRIELNEDLDAAAIRILEYRVGLKKLFLQQFELFGKLNRCKHFSESETKLIVEKAVEEDFSSHKLSQRVLSVGYYSLVDINRVETTTDIYSDRCEWVPISEVPKLLFDHNEMMDSALKRLQREVKYQPVGDLLSVKFTMAELQKLYEVILNRSLDRRNFHKQMAKLDFLVKLEEKRTGMANKSPNLYRFDHPKYQEALDEGMGF